LVKLIWLRRTNKRGNAKGEVKAEWTNKKMFKAFFVSHRDLLYRCASNMKANKNHNRFDGKSSIAAEILWLTSV
jgi:hypothetical protein